MGSGQSTQSPAATGASLEDKRKSPETDSAAENVNSNESTKPSQEGGGCPMKRADGSFTYDWGALFRPNFPHMPNGSKPLSDQQIADARNDASNGTLVSKEGGCPVKSKQGVQYNVYSQPILNPSNNMPQNPNQLPAPTQAVPLSTERVASSIPKVRLNTQDADPST